MVRPLLGSCSPDAGNGTKSVEDDIQKACDRFEDATQKIVEDLSKMVISSIGAVITAFIAASFKKDISVPAFRAILGIYTVYLSLVTAFMGFKFLWERFESSLAHFNARRTHHDVILGSLRVDAIIGKRVKDGQRRFRLWFVVGIGVCAVFVIGQLVLIWCAKELLSP